MNSFREFIRNWFGFTRRERRSTFILLIIILIVSGIRIAIPDSTISVEMIPLNFTDDPFDTIQQEKRDHHLYKPGNEPKYGSKKTLLEINTCDSLSLVALPGIGPVLSARIIKYRNLVGGFWSVDQLKEVYGLPPETLEKISSMLYVDSLKIRKIKINSAGYREMIRNPYFRKEEVPAIIKYRDLRGEIKDLGELKENKILSSETIKKIAPYIDYSK
jgi:DNA uptake protein ComE-like DNA-binding protein